MIAPILESAKFCKENGTPVTVPRGEEEKVNHLRCDQRPPTVSEERRLIRACQCRRGLMNTDLVIGPKLIAKGQKSNRADELKPTGPYIFIFIIYFM